MPVTVAIKCNAIKNEIIICQFFALIKTRLVLLPSCGFIELPLYLKTSIDFNKKVGHYIKMLYIGDKFCKLLH